MAASSTVGTWLNVAIIVLPLTAAALVGQWPNEIANATPIRSWPPAAVSWQATAFWAVLLAAIGCGIANGIRGRRAEDRAERLAVAHGLGPAATALYDLCRETAAKYRKDNPHAAIRAILEGLTQLAWLHDGKPQNTRYAANVMLFVPRGEITDAHRARLNFWDGNEEELRGVLDVQLALSTSIGTTGRRDADLAQIALPVPVTATVRRWFRQRHRALPGAPQAFARADTDSKHDSSDLVSWCRWHGAFEPWVETAIARYLATPEGTKTKSLVSIALRAPNPIAEPLGILNIHRDKPGILEDQPAAFLLHSASFQGLIVDILAREIKRTQTHA